MGQQEKTNPGFEELYHEDEENQHH